MRNHNIGSYGLFFRYPFTSEIPSLGKDMFGIDIPKKLSPGESLIDRQARCLEHYGPHIVSNMGEAVSWRTEYKRI